MDPESELELVRRLRVGDRAAFDVVYEMFNARLFSFLARVTRSRERAEDLLEETWLRLVTHADRLRPDTRLGPWLFTVARNLHLSYCRSHLLDEVYPEEGLSLWPIAATPSPFEETAANELDRRIEAALATLPVLYREVILLVAVEGLAQSEAASICGINTATLRQRLKRARDLLARRLDAEARPAPGRFREVIT
jgi:RNA polymerase sigma-70 factor, ECF subfamily